MPKAGPGSASSSAAGRRASTSSTSGCSELLPNSMFISWPASVPMVRGSSESVTRQQVAEAAGLSSAPSSGSIASTRATISSRIHSSRIADTGISTLCSTAIDSALASIAAAAQRTR